MVYVNAYVMHGMHIPLHFQILAIRPFSLQKCRKDMMDLVNIELAINEINL